MQTLPVLTSTERRLTQSFPRDLLRCWPKKWDVKFYVSKNIRDSGVTIEYPRCSSYGLTDLRSASSQPAVDNTAMTGSNVLSISSKWAPAIDQVRK
jgi:hypothetical protein